MGLFFGTVYDLDKNLIYYKNFMNMAQLHYIRVNKKFDEFELCEEIGNWIELHFENHVANDDTDIDDSKTYASGFGGKYGSGLIDFNFPLEDKKLPDLRIKIGHEKFNIVWDYSEGSQF
jgi:hypothetical protein